MHLSSSPCSCPRQDRLRRAETARDGTAADLAATGAKAEDLSTQLASAEEGLRHAEQALMDAQDRVQHYKVCVRVGSVAGVCFVKPHVWFAEGGLKARGR